MKKKIEICDFCGEPIVNQTTCIAFSTPDLDLHGIWFGDVLHWFYLTGQVFCNYQCMLNHLNSWHARMALEREAEKGST